MRKIVLTTIILLAVSPALAGHGKRSHYRVGYYSYNGCGPSVYDASGAPFAQYCIRLNR